MRTAGKLADLSMALAGRFTEHHALLCRLHRDRIAVFDDAVDGLDAQIAAQGRAAGSGRRTCSSPLPGFGDVVCAGWLAAIGPAPHQHFASHEKLASWVDPVPGEQHQREKAQARPDRRRRHLHQAAADPGRLGRGPGPRPAAGPVQPAGPPVRRPAEPGREEEGDHRDRAHPAQDRLPGPQERDALPGPGRRLLHPAGIPRSRGRHYLERQLQKLHPGCTITVTISPPEAALPPALNQQP